MSDYMEDIKEPILGEQAKAKVVRQSAPLYTQRRPTCQQCLKTGDVIQRIDDCLSDGNTLFSSKRVDF